MKNSRLARTIVLAFRVPHSRDAWDALELVLVATKGVGAVTFVRASLVGPWGTGHVALLALVLTILFLGAAFRLQGEVDRLQLLGPRLITEAGSLAIAYQGTSDNLRPMHTHTVAVASFRNEPEQRVPESRAVSVTARLSYYSTTGQKLTSREIYTSARWYRPPELDEDEPLFVEPTEGLVKVSNEATFEVNGAPHQIDLVWTLTKEGFSVFPGARSGSSSQPGLPSEFHVRVWLTGERIDEQHWFRVRRASTGHGPFEVEEIPNQR